MPATVNVPEISTLSLMSIVPPAELRIRFPVAVSIVLSLVSAILISPKCASENGSAAVPT